METRVVKLKPVDPDFDPYGKDLSKISTGEGVYRIEPSGRVVAVPEEEQLRNLPKKKKPMKRYRKGMGA
jgi:hypothetical protein